MANNVIISPWDNLLFNEDACKAISSEIANNFGSTIPQPVITIGQNGAGKTTLLKRIYDSDICREIPKIWIDGRSVFCSEDIISQAPQAKGTIIFIDDFDFYLTRSPYENQSILRRFLYNENAPMMIASIRKILPALTDYDAPFFEGMKNIYLSPISSKTIDQLFREQDKARALNLMNLLPPTIKSAETVYGILRVNDIPKEDIAILLSLFSDRYRESYQNLPINSQHILNAFGSGDSHMKLPDIRNKTQISTNVLTVYLKGLTNIGIIKVDKSKKRNTKYSMKDPLFQLWLAQSAQT